MSVPKVSLVVEVEGTPRIELRAEDADLDSLFEWLRSDRVRRQLDALALLISGRDTSD